MQSILKSKIDTPKSDIKTVVSQVEILILLPSNEEPKLATVSDKTKLNNQLFFAHAENGDKVLIYTQAEKAILYRPSINKIIEVGPINLSETSTKKISTTSATQQIIPAAAQPTNQLLSARVAIYNGSKIMGLAGATEKLIKEKLTNIKVVQKTNSKGDYSSNLIIDITGQNSEMVQKIASLLGGVIGVIPPDEAKPDADILVILGK